MSDEAHRVIDKEFEEMINDICGEKTNRRLPDKYRHIPTPDFYDLPMHHEDFMKWYKERDEERYKKKTAIKCECGAIYTIYTEPMETLRYDFQGQGLTSTTDLYSQQQVHIERFFCCRCGMPFSITGGKIVKIKSNQLEVVL